MYLDDVQIFSKLVEDHVAHVYEVIYLLGAAGIYMKLRKRSLFKYRADYLRHFVLPKKLASMYQNSEAAL